MQTTDQFLLISYRTRIRIIFGENFQLPRNHRRIFDKQLSPIFLALIRVRHFSTIPLRKNPPPTDSFICLLTPEPSAFSGQCEFSPKRHLKNIRDENIIIRRRKLFMRQSPSNAGGLFSIENPDSDNACIICRGIKRRYIIVVLCERTRCSPQQCIMRIPQFCVENVPFSFMFELHVRRVCVRYANTSMYIHMYNFVEMYRQRRNFLLKFRYNM